MVDKVVDAKVIEVNVLPRIGYSKPYKSRRNAVPVHKFWLEGARPRNERIGRMLPPLAMGIGFLMLLAGAYWGYSEVPQHKYREVWFEDFSEGLDLINSWNREMEVGGYGVQTFDWTTDFDNNSYVKEGVLHIYPTLTQWPPQVDGSIVNLTADGTCSSTGISDCVAQYNSSTFQIINPVQSARLTTKGKHTLRYGKVEVRAKLPRGRYLWPAIWLMPQDSVYGIWPASGEIDMLESHGNDPYAPSSFTGSNCAISSLHWGPIFDNPDHYVPPSTTTQQKCLARRSLNEDYHTYIMEWTPQGIDMYIDNPLYTLYALKFKHASFVTGKFAALDNLGSPTPNPWSASQYKSAPFDKEFYLILNLAVAGTNGFFPGTDTNNPAYSNSLGGQPYEAMQDFWLSQHQWYPSWPDDERRSLSIDWIRFSELVDTEHWENLPSARVDS